MPGSEEQNIPLFWSLCNSEPNAGYSRLLVKPKVSSLNQKLNTETGVVYIIFFITRDRQVNHACFFFNGLWSFYFEMECDFGSWRKNVMGRYKSAVLAEVSCFGVNGKIFPLKTNENFFGCTFFFAFIGHAFISCIDHNKNRSLYKPLLKQFSCHSNLSIPKGFFIG
jgi:hypothetical protein